MLNMAIRRDLFAERIMAGVLAGLEIPAWIFGPLGRFQPGLVQHTDPSTFRARLGS